MFQGEWGSFNPGAVVSIPEPFSFFSDPEACSCWCFRGSGVVSGLGFRDLGLI